MPTQEIDITTKSSADPAAVWRLLADSASWPSWTPIDSHQPVSPPGPDGTGEVRAFRNGRHTVREQIVQMVPERRLSYTLLAGLALRDYRADVDLAATPSGGTEIRWHTTFRPKVPGTGRLYRTVLEKATRQFVDGLASAAEQADAGPRTP